MIPDLIVSFFASLLAGTGVGGGGLLVIYLTLARGFEQLCAQGVNLAFFVAGASSSLPIHIKRRRIDALPVAVLGIAGAVGACLGLWLAKKLDARLLRIIFGAFLVFCGMRTLRSK